jgi:CRP-like cAMP-binding protein
MQGHVRAVHFGADGRPVTVLMAWPSEPIGLMAALADDQYGTTFEAAENNTAVAMFAADAFRRLMRDEPNVMMSVINELARQMTDMVTMVKTLSADVPARVAIYMLLLDEQTRWTRLVTVDWCACVELMGSLGDGPGMLS